MQNQLITRVPPKKRVPRTSRVPRSCALFANGRVRAGSIAMYAALLLLTAITGCGYHVAGSATHVPANVRTLAVPIFKTNVQQYRTEVAITEATIRELNTRTRYRITESDNLESADATLQGTVLTETIAPLTYDPSTGSTSSYMVQITAKIVLTARDGRILYRNDKLSFREQYQSTQDLSAFIQEDSAAVHRLSRDMASEIVADILKSF